MVNNISFIFKTKTRKFYINGGEGGFYYTDFYEGKIIIYDLKKDKNK